MSCKFFNSRPFLSFFPSFPDFLIRYHSNVMRVDQVLRMHSEDYLKLCPVLPNRIQPSDHFPLVVDFKLNLTH